MRKKAKPRVPAAAPFRTNSMCYPLLFSKYFAYHGSICANS